MNSERLGSSASDDHTAWEPPAKVRPALAFLQMCSALQCCGLCWAWYKHQNVILQEGPAMSQVHAVVHLMTFRKACLLVQGCVRNVLRLGCHL